MVIPAHHLHLRKPDSFPSPWGLGWSGKQWKHWWATKCDYLVGRAKRCDRYETINFVPWSEKGATLYDSLLLTGFWALWARSCLFAAKYPLFCVLLATRHFAFLLPYLCKDYCQSFILICNLQEAVWSGVA